MPMRRPMLRKEPATAAYDALTVVLCSNLVVAQAIARALGIRRARAWRDASDVVAEWQGQPPELLILIDLAPTLLPRVVRQLKRRWPQVRTLGLGLPNHEESILGSVAAGIDGIVLQEESLDQFVYAVQAVRAGAFRPPPKLIRPLLDRLVRLEARTGAAGNSTRLVRLTTHERDILTQVTRGGTNKQIAVALYVEEQTIKNQLLLIFRKLNLHTRADAVRVWMQSALGRDESGRAA